MKRILVIAVALLAIAGTSSFAAMGLYDLGAGAAPSGVSTDGSGVAFDLGGANIWLRSTAASSNIGAGYATTGITYTTYKYASGKYVVAANSTGNAYRYDSSTGVWTQLPKADGASSWVAGGIGSAATDVWIPGGVGASSTAACRYKESGASTSSVQAPGDASPSNYGQLYGCSDNGHYAGKYKVNNGAKKADATPYLGGALMGLNYIAGQTGSGTAFAISRDGRYAGGYSGAVPAMWDLALANGGSGIQVPSLPGANYGEVHAINQTGTMAYGNQRFGVSGSFTFTAFAYDRVANTTTDLATYLAGKGINVTGWTFTNVCNSGVSGDDKVLAGTGLYGGVSHGWVVVVPEPSSFCALALGLLGLLKLRRRA